MGLREGSSTTRQGRLSAIILAGGESSRMGSDKAFLYHQGRPFVSAIAAEMAKVCDEVVVMVGSRRRDDFSAVLDQRVKVFSDDSYMANPLGGILSGLQHVTHKHAAVVACDSPLVRAEAVAYLFGALGDRSAAVPVWEEGDANTMEPLCAVYDVAEARRAIQQTLKEGKATLKQMVLRIRDVLYVDVSQLRLVDPMLDSLVNVNTRDDYAALQRRDDSPAAGYPGFSQAV